MEVKKLRSQAMRVVCAQLIFLLLLTAIAWCLYNGYVARSLVLGGSICIIPNLIFALIYFSKTGALAAKQLVRNFYKAEVAKLLLTATLFTLVMVYLPFHPAALFIGFILTQAVFWLAPIIIG